MFVWSCIGILFTFEINGPEIKKEEKRGNKINDLIAWTEAEWLDDVKIICTLQLQTSVSTRTNKHNYSNLTLYTSCPLITIVQIIHKWVSLFSLSKNVQRLWRKITNPQCRNIPKSKVRGQNNVCSKLFQLTISVRFLKTTEKGIGPWFCSFPKNFKMFKNQSLDLVRISNPWAPLF